MATGDELLQWKKEVEDKELEEITECPFCYWPLDINAAEGVIEANPRYGQKSCPICGRIWK